MIHRIFDFIIALSAAIIFAVPHAVIMAGIKLFSPGPVLYRSRRAGRLDQFFIMQKLRSMRIDTPETATGKLGDANGYITPFGSFLRQTSLNALPHKYSVLRGDISIVGSRPALHNQHELIGERAALGLNQLRPRVTGWAQIIERDEIALQDKLRFDQDYLERQSLLFDLKIIGQTVVAVVSSQGVSH